MDGPPAPPPFVYNYNASTSRSSLGESVSLTDDKLNQTSINKLPKNTNQGDELEAALDKVNQNLKTTNISISEASSSSKATNSSVSRGNIQSVDDKKVRLLVILKRLDKSFFASKKHQFWKL